MASDEITTLTYMRTAKGVVRLFLFWIFIFSLVPIQFLARFGIGPDPVLLGRFAYRVVIRILGFKIRVLGTMSENRPTFFVANHTSYLDVPVLGALIPALFVAKSEVAGWPIFGFLTKVYNTVFVERRAIRAATQRDVMRDKLEQGHSLILFPEGTSTDGLRVLPFKSSLFSIVETPLPPPLALVVQPVSVVFHAISGLPVGRTWRHYYTWYGDMTLIGHLFRAFCYGHFSVDVVFHPPLSGEALQNRKELALHCQRAVAYGVDACLRGAPEVYTKPMIPHKA